ncbi:MAG: hypothetical protein RR316_04295, partial [Clostridia bacterium]
VVCFAQRFEITKTDDFVSPLNLIILGSDFKPAIAPDYRSAEYAVFNVNEYYTDLLGNYTKGDGGEIVDEEKKVKIDQATLDTRIKQTVEAMESRLNLLTTGERKITVLDGNKIRVEVDNLYSSATILDIMNIRGVMELKLLADKPDDKTVFTDYKNVLTSEQYEFTQISQDEQQKFAIILSFVKDGKDAFIEATKAVKTDTDKTMYLCLLSDGKLVGTPLTVSTVFSKQGTYTYIGGFETQNDAIKIGMLMNGGHYDVAFQKANLNIKALGADLGENAARNVLLTMVVLIAAVMVILIVIYGLNGFAASLSMICFTIMTVVLLAIIPTVPFNMSNALGVIIGIVIAAATQIVLLNSIKNEYQITNKNRKLCLKDGYKNAMWTIIDIHVVVLIVAIICAVAIPGLVRGFAMAIVFTMLASAISSLLLTPSLFKLTNGLSLNDKLFGLKRNSAKEAK